MTDNDDESSFLLQEQNDIICSVEENRDELCLICCSKVDTDLVQKYNTELLDNNLLVIFMLRNLLKVPISQLEGNLKEYGNPSSWIKLCDQCTKIAIQAEKLYCQIKENSRDIGSIQKLIVSKIRTRSSNNKDKTNSGNCKRAEIKRKIHNFVNKYGYIEQASNSDNPFSEGDKLAKYLIKSQTTSELPTTSDTQLDDEYHDEDNSSICHDNWDGDGDLNDIGDNSQGFKTDKQNVNRKITTKPTSRTSQSSKRLKLTSGSKRPYQKMININGKWKCRHCDKLFLSSSACNVHEKKIHYSNPSEQYICDICGKSLRDSNSVLVHRRSVHKIRLDGTRTNRKPKKPEPPRKKYPSTCTICGKHFQDRTNLKNHIIFVHEKKDQYKCEICGITAFARKFDLKRHQLTIHKDNPLVKDLIEEGINIWRCKIKGCRAQFIKKRNLDKHCENIHKDPDANGRFACSFCGRLFWEMHNLRNHEMVHKNQNEGVNPFCCEMCGLGFPGPAYLNNHKQNVHKRAKNELNN